MNVFLLASVLLKAYWAKSNLTSITFFPGNDKCSEAQKSLVEIQSMFSRAKTKFPYRCIFIFYYKLFYFNFILIYSNLHLFFPFALVSVIFFMLKHVKIVQVEKKRFGPQNYGRGPFIRI